MPKEMAKDAPGETELDADAPPPVDVQLHCGRDGADVDAGDVGAVGRIPLQPRQVGDFVATSGKTLGEAPVPPLGAADGVRVQAVENDADAQADKIYRLLMAAEAVPGRSNLESSDMSQAAQAEPRAAARRQTALRTVAIVPALNEEHAVGSVIDELRAYDPGLDVIVIDDGSTDGTATVAAQRGARVIRLPFNLGIGGAMQTGFRYAFQAGFDAAVQVDGDGQHDPAELPKLLLPLEQDRADIVVGSRFAGDRSYRAPFFRRLGIALFARTISLIVRQRVTDTTSGFRAMNRRGIALFAADYPHDYPEVEATVMVVRHELRLVEVSVAMRDRVAGRSSITASQSIYYMVKVLLAIFVSLFRRNVVPLKEET